MIYLLIVNYYSTDFIVRLITSLPSSQIIPYQIVIVNNSPNDNALQGLKNERILILEANANLGFGRACNLGLNWIYAQDNQAIAWIINPDTYLPEDTLEKLPHLIEAYPKLSIIGTLIYTPASDIWFAGGQFNPNLGAIISTNSLSSKLESTCVSCDWVSGCSLIINLRHFPECPQFDPAYFLYYEDFDFCRRYATLGHQIGITNQISIVHQPSSITDRNLAKKFQYSTYSYLLTLERYTKKEVLLWRFLRLTLHALMLLELKPQTAFGKLAGVSSYLRRVKHTC